MSFAEAFEGPAIVGSQARRPNSVQSIADGLHLLDLLALRLGDFSAQGNEFRIGKVSLAAHQDRPGMAT